MNMETMIKAMQNGKTSVMLYKSEYGRDYNLTVQTTNQHGTAFKIERSSEDPLEAVQMVYNEWLKLTSDAPQLIDALPKPQEDVQDADDWI